MSIRNLGRKSLTEIKGLLSENGLQLGMYIPELPDSSREKKVRFSDIEEGIRFLENHIDKLTLLGSKDSNSIDLSLRLTELPYETILKLVHKIEDLDLSFRSLSCLKDLKIKYIGDLVGVTEAKLLKTKNFGRKSLSEIKDKLKKKNLSLDINW